MSVKTVVSTHTDPRACARQLRDGIGDLDPTFVAFFATSKLDPESLGAALRQQFGEVPSIGCTTAGEIGGRRPQEGSVVLLAMDANSIRSAQVEVIDDLANEAATRRAVNALAASRGETASALRPDKYLGMIVHDGLSRAEESIMARITALTNVPFIGGSAGDDLVFRRTFVYANFRPHTDASALALLEPVRRYEILKTQSFAVLDKTLEVTEVDEPTRTVHSFNGRPAAQEFAALLGVPVSELPDNFRKFAVGLVTREGEPYVRSPQRVQGESLVFYCQLKQGMRLNLLQAQDIVQKTRHDLTSKLASLGSCEAIVEFQCINRTQELESQHQSQVYAELFKSIPTIGLATYGESYIGHLNQTSTLLLFGGD